MGRDKNSKLTVKGIKKHFITITTHRHEVIKLCFKAGIGIQGLFHDLSKYSLAEFIPCARYATGKKSPHEILRKEQGFSESWMHHVGANKHHFEHWYDYNPETGNWEAVKMPNRYVIESFCDRVAAAKIYGGANYTDDSPLIYFNNRMGTEGKAMNPSYKKKMEFLLKMFAEKGEEETFKFLRKQKIK